MNDTSTSLQSARNSIVREDVESPPIPHALSLIHSHLTGFAIDIDKIENKLSVVMGPDHREPTPSPGATKPQNSELVGVLDDFSDTIGHLRARLDGIMARVEL